MIRFLGWFIIIFFVHGCLGYCHAQKNDYIWLSGYGAYPHPYFEPATHFANATNVMDFNYDPVRVSYDSLQMNFALTNTSFCDDEGSLLFYSNGIYVANALDEEIDNSDSLNTGYELEVLDPSWKTYGYNTWQGILALPDGRNPNFYYLPHSFIDSMPGATYNIYCRKTLVTYLDMSANNTHGRVVYKNKEIVNDTAGLSGELTATRHGNGKDWWVVVQRRNSNCYYRILIDSDGAHLLPDLNCGGLTITSDNIGAACFSPDGQKYVYFGAKKGLTILDFDRCAGTLSNPQSLPISMLADSFFYGAGLAISPNSRFLYISATHYLYQIDLNDPNPFSSIDTFVWDRFRLWNNPQYPTVFGHEQLAPDGRIYISGPYVQAYNVIVHPNLKGDSCDFEQHDFLLTGASAGVPNFPNYRLGRAVGSECDTLWNGVDEVTIQEREKILKVFPSPATDIISIDYGYTNWSNPAPVQLEITNELGQIVYRQDVPRYSGVQKVDVSQFAAGLYTAYIKRNTAIVATCKFAKQ